MHLQWSLPALQLPYLCHGRFVLRLVVLAQAVAVVLAFSPGIDSDPWYRLGVISLFVHWVALLTTLCFCYWRSGLNKLRPTPLLLVCIAIFASCTVLVSVLAYYWLSAQRMTMTQGMLAFVLANLMICLIVAIIAIQFFIIHSEKNQQIRAQSRAEFTALQARIEPHFLFNSLNTVAELTQVNPDAAEKALLDLSALFRAALHAGEKVSLAEELSLAQQYLSLEQWRLGDRMQVNWELPAQLPILTLPALTVQPLLENAVRHGIERSTATAVLQITLVESRHAVTIVITNPVVAAKASRSGNGIALSNIRQRLQLHYGAAAQLHSALHDGQFRVKLVLPKEPA